MFYSPISVKILFYLRHSERVNNEVLITSIDVFSRKLVSILIKFYSFISKASVRNEAFIDFYNELLFCVYNANVKAMLIKCKHSVSTRRARYSSNNKSSCVSSRMCSVVSLVALNYNADFVYIHES